ncbi:CidA/LrgA family protein [Gelidibacter gilvus]|uniref:CidA/LrgA family protein n=1 Tax=Gelidibacter gilvus TaxID=59602 RepID=UPI001CB9355A|nr:CidA/LrgA family protein [Gelidibacter gilvus]
MTIKSFKVNFKNKRVLHTGIKLLKAFLILFLFLGLGELIKYFIEIPIPGNILGMVLIFIALKLKLIKLEWVKPASDTLLNYLVLFFIPFGVGLMSYFDFINLYWVILCVAAGLSTLITLYVTALIQQKLEKHD